MSINFNDTTPAAPTNFLNVKFQSDGTGNVSAYTQAPTWVETFVPTITPSGSMTVSSVTTLITTWTRFGSIAIFSFVLGATIGGTVSTKIDISLPVAMAGARSMWGTGQVNSPTAAAVLAVISSSSPTVVSCSPFGGANYTLGAFSLGATIIYRCA